MNMFLRYSKRYYIIWQTIFEQGGRISHKLYIYIVLYSNISLCRTYFKRPLSFCILAWHLKNCKIIDTYELILLLICEGHIQYYSSLRHRLHLKLQNGKVGRKGWLLQCFGLVWDFEQWSKSKRDSSYFSFLNQRKCIHVPCLATETPLQVRGGGEGASSYRHSDIAMCVTL